MNTPEIKKIEKGLYKHFKGNQYEVIDTVIHSETLETYVLYRPIKSETLWVRPYDMFVAEVEHEGKIVRRFEKVHEGEKLD